MISIQQRRLYIIHPPKTEASANPVKPPYDEIIEAVWGRRACTQGLSSREQISISWNVSLIELGCVVVCIPEVLFAFLPLSRSFSFCRLSFFFVFLILSLSLMFFVFTISVCLSCCFATLVCASPPLCFVCFVCSAVIALPLRRSTRCNYLLLNPRQLKTTIHENRLP